MKKLLVLLMIFALLMSAVGCGGKGEMERKETEKPEEKAATAQDEKTEAGEAEKEAAAETEEVSADESVEGKLVIYTTTYDIEYQLIIENGFQKKYPKVQIETVQAGAGELKTRIEAEGANPQGDVMFGGLSYADADLGLWENYVSPNDETMPESMRNTTGFLSWTTIQLENFLINYEAAKAAKLDVDSLTSFDALLKPELKGKIIWCDPAASSSAWNMLATILLVKGGYESQEAWDYIDQLLQNGVVVGTSSSGVYKSVYAGEYVLGLTYEAPCVSYYEGGEDHLVKIVFPEEGTSAFPFASAIIKGAKNMDIAKRFMDYLVSVEAQKRWASSTARQANTDLPTTNPFLTKISEIKVIDTDHQYLKDHKEEILAKFQEIYAKYNR